MGARGAQAAQGARVAQGAQGAHPLTSGTPAYTPRIRSINPTSA